jgi:3-hydroxyacyl-CoA dehydrogenase/enoyl-CoA hydratase/3-hydroxybutyryl-CoA epimerase
MQVETNKSIQEFRSYFTTEAISFAEKSLFLEKKGEVGVLVFDTYNEKANKLSSPMMLRLYDLFMQVEQDMSIKSLLIIGKKPTIFIAGADIAEIQKFTTGEASVDTLIKLQSVFNILEKLRVPTVVAIHGACMGGGTELSLACDYRIATDAPETKIALPEVQLGIIPGWGGTQRMPRLMGLEKSLDLIMSGRPVDGKTAKKMGLVDKVFAKEFLEEKALNFAKELAASGKKRKYTGANKSLIEKIPGGKMLIFDQAKKKLLEKTKGHYPAPLAALEVIKKTYGGDLTHGLKVEATAFAELVKSDICKNLIRIFFLTEKVKKDKGISGDAKPLAINFGAVLGAGVMGGGIAQLFAAKNIRVRMKDINWDAITKGYQAAASIFKKLVKRRKIKQSEFDNLMAKIEGTTTFSGFSEVDLVVEAIVEDLEIKKKVFSELDKAVKDTAILATNTSSLSVTQIASGSKDPSRVVGMHFFNPVDKMPLVEVIRAEKSSDEAVSTVFQLSKKLGKTPIVVKDSPGFVVNRILGPYLMETMHLLVEGVPVNKIDEALEKFGMPMGPCTLIDEVGIDVLLKVGKVLYGAFGERLKAPISLDGFVAEKSLGKKSGKGIFIYEQGKKGPVDSAMLNKFNIKQNHNLDLETIQKRCVYLMINEAARCLEEKIARDASDIDIGMIFGTGFAPFRGGVLRYADSLGAEKICSDLEVFTRTYGNRFKPCDLLQKMSIEKKLFY